MEHRVKIVGVALLCVAVGSEALTLGRARGAALIGRPLDLVVQVQMDAGDDAPSLCFDAEVFHADTRQDASRVRVVVEAAAQPHVANVRVLSSAVVDEPVVTVYLRTGCGQKTTRRYVLLADLPSEVAAPSAPPVVLASSPAKVALIPATPGSASLPSKASASAAATPVSATKAKTVRTPKQTVRREVDNKRPEATAAVTSPKSVTSDTKSKAGRSAGQSRLKLDPLELLSDRVADIDSFMTFAPPEDALLNMQKMQTLEGNVKALLALATKNEASLVDLKARLQRAEAERFPGGLIYGLLALLLACLAAVAWLWSRQRRIQPGGEDWWSGSIAAPSPASLETEPVPPPEPVAAPKERGGEIPATKKTRTAALPGLLNGSGPLSDVDVNLTEMSDSNFDVFMQSGVAQSASRKKPPSPPPFPTTGLQTGLARGFNSEVTLDIRQQAEFFVSLGQTDRAVRVLKKQINESDEPNPFIYLDLLSIFHSLSLKTDFQQLREDFNRLFNGRVPEFTFFKDEGRGLESYPDVLSRITALWPTPKALGVIDACIFQDPRQANSQSFDLAAFRDLLLLYAIARSVVLAPHPEGGDLRVGATPSVTARASSPPNFTDSGDTVSAPSSVSGRPGSVEPDLSLEEIRLPRVLDLDLTDSNMEGFASNPVSATDIDLPLPLLMLGDFEVDGQGEDAIRPLESGNLVDFDLPETPKRPGSAGN